MSMLPLYCLVNQLAHQLQLALNWYCNAISPVHQEVKQAGFFLECVFESQHVAKLTLPLRPSLPLPLPLHMLGSLPPKNAFEKAFDR